MIIIAAIYHQHRYLTSVAHAQFGQSNVKPVSNEFKN
jgi:hypothetical protein